MKYSSFEELKLDTTSAETNSVDSAERHLSLEKFIILLQTGREKKQSANPDKVTKKRI